MDRFVSFLPDRDAFAVLINSRQWFPRYTQIDLSTNVNDYDHFVAWNIECFKSESAEVHEWINTTLNMIERLKLRHLDLCYAALEKNAFGHIDFIFFDSEKRIVCGHQS